MPMTLFPRSPFRGGRRVIDISGDGSNNRGRPVTLARDEAVAAGIGINGLPILALEPDLDRYYYDSVIGGPGAFVVAARELRDLRRRHPEETDYRDRRQHTAGARPRVRAQALGRPPPPELCPISDVVSLTDQ